MGKDIETISKKQVTSIRSKIFEFENHIKQMKGAMIGDNPLTPVKHSFSDGIYIREMFIPKGTMIVGKIHKHDHPSFLLKGDITIYSEEKGEQRLKAPMHFVSPGGIKRIGYAHQDTVWVTLHKNESNTRDLKLLEKEITADSYDEFEKCISNKETVLIEG